MMTKITLGITAAILILGFQNCSPGFEIYSEASTLTSAELLCEATEVGNFEKTYYPILRSQCASCHVPSGFAPGGFAAAALQDAFNGFQSTTQAKILANGSNPAHGAGAGKSENFAKIEAAQLAYDTCVEKLRPPLPVGTAARTAPIIMNATPNAQILSFNLNSQMELGGANFGDAQLLVTVSRATIGGTNVYLIGNPSLRTGTSSIQVKTLRFKVNGVRKDTWTTFTQVDRTIAAATNPQNGQALNGNLAVGNGPLDVDTFNVTDTLQVEFETLRIAP